MSPKEASSPRGARRGRGPHAQAQQPRQGALPADRHDQGRGAQLLRPIAPVLLPHLRDRAVTRVRWPHGVDEAELLREEHPGGHAVVGAHRRGADDRLAGASRHGDVLVFPVVDDLADPDLAGQPRRARAARAPVDGQQGRASRAGPRTGSSSTSTRATGAGLHECCQVALLVRDRLAERGLRREAVTSGSKGLHLYAALPARKRPRRVHGARQGDRRGAREGAPQLVTATMTKSQAVREGLPRLVAERRLQDHAHAVLAARARAADGRDARHLGRGRGRRRGPARARAVPLRGGARAGGRRSVDPLRVRSAIVTKAFMFCG